MAGPIEVQLRNAQSSILFMQQEHAQTLQGLHGELQKLQKKCAELTFELAMKSDDADEDQHLETQQKLEAKLEKTESQVEELNKLLQEKDRKIFSLEQQLKLQEKKLLSEVKQNKQKLSTMCNELDQKSANIAYLTNQLHQMALVKHKVKDCTRTNRRAHSNSPQPPQKPPPTHRRRVRTPVDMESVTVLRNGLVSDAESSNSPSRHSSRRLSSSADTRSYSDREVAAYVAKVDTVTSDIDIKPAPPILPPISPFPQDTRGVRSSSLYSHGNSPYYSRRALRASKHREPDSAEIGSLAVQAVHQRKKDLHAAQQSNGDSS